MPQISHPNFTHMGADRPQQTLKPTAKAPKTADQPVHVVMPAEDEADQFEAQMAVQEARFETQAGSSGIPGVLSDAVMKAEMDRKSVFNKLVLFRGEHLTEIEAGGLRFKFKLLNANENAYVLKQIKKIPTDEQMSKLSLMVLAAALVDVNGVKLEDAYTGPDEIVDPVLRRYYEINLWASPITNALSLGYHRFQAKTEAEYTKDFLEQ